MKRHEDRTRRMREQKWTFDKIIEATGVDFFWLMSRAALGAAGLDVANDINTLRLKVKKYTDISQELARIAAKREAMAKKAEDEGHLITARDNYFSAAIFYTFAQGPIHQDDNVENIAYSAKKNECYDRFIKNAPRRVEKVEIPFEDKSLPGFLHFPTGKSQGVPCVIHLGGMDMFKEMLTPVYGDKLLERGMAVLSFDGPGQDEALITRKIRCTADNFIKAGQAAMDFLLKQPEIDANRIAIAGISMGSFWVTQIVAHDHRFKAAAVAFVCHEPGMDTIFNVACPIFKEKFMWMAGYEDEEEFDRFAETLTLKGLGARIKCPFLIVAGEKDELSPIEYSYDLYDEITSPKKIVVYEGEGHGPSQIFDARALIADWLKDRLDGKSMRSERIISTFRAKE